MKKVLVLTMSVDHPPYAAMMEKSLQTWDSINVDGIENVFYCGKSHKQNTDKVIYTQFQDAIITGRERDFYNMGHKTLEAFEWALNNKEFDFIYRANASLYVNKKLLLEYVQDKPTENCYLGVMSPITFEGSTFNYVWGPGYLLSKDVVKKVVENKDKWNHRAMDDVALSNLAHDLGIPCDNSGFMGCVHPRPSGYHVITYNHGGVGGDIETMEELNKMKLPVIRVKHDPDRSVDLQLMDEIFKAVDK